MRQGFEFWILVMVLLGPWVKKLLFSEIRLWTQSVLRCLTSWRTSCATFKSSFDKIIHSFLNEVDLWGHFVPYTVYKAPFFHHRVWLYACCHKQSNSCVSSINLVHLMLWKDIFVVATATATHVILMMQAQLWSAVIHSTTNNYSNMLFNISVLQVYRHEIMNMMGLS